jgi:hypothetical protein
VQSLLPWRTSVIRQCLNLTRPDLGIQKRVVLLGTRYKQFGGLEVLEYGDLPDPVAAAGEVLVDVVAASVSRRFVQTCDNQAFSQSLGRKHNPSDISRLVDLGPMPRFKDMKRSIPGLRSHVLGDGDMKIGVGLSPNE